MATRLMLRTKVSPSEEMQAMMAAFEQRCRARNLSPGTIGFYNYRFLAFRRFLEAEELDLAPADVTPPVIRKFLESERTRNSACCAKQSFRTLSAFFNFLVSDGYLSESPMKQVESVRQPLPVVPVVSMAQVEALLATCDHSFTGVRDRAIIMTLLDTGLRVAELCTAPLAGIDWNAQTLAVMGKGAKGRQVPFGTATKTALLAYMGRRGNVQGVGEIFVTVLGDPFKPKGVLEMLKTRAGRAELTEAHITPHQFRRAFAVQFIRNGGDPFTVQKILGHTDLTMTRRYAELSQTDVVEKHRRYSPADALPAPKASGRKRKK